MSRHHYQLAALAELDCFRIQVQEAKGKWTGEGVPPLLAEADSMLGSLFEIVASLHAEDRSGDAVGFEPLTDCGGLQPVTDKQTTLAEIGRIRARLDAAGSRWAHTGALEADSDNAHAMIAYADSCLGKVYDLIACDGLTDQQRREASWRPQRIAA